MKVFLWILVVGACWAFASVAAVEAVYQISEGILVPLSEQQLIDCDKKSEGCVSGSFDNGFQAIIDSDGVLQEADYPYQALVQTCQLNEYSEPDAYISSYKYIKQNDEEQLLAAVTQQPVTVSISPSPEFQAYEEGVYSGSCGTENTHAVTIVGYGTTEEGLKYWLIKNSWSKNWGEDGYMRIRRQSGGPEGHCGLAKFGGYPVI